MTPPRVGWLYWLPTALVGASLLAFLAVWTALPATCPVGYNLHGEAAGDGPKGQLLVMPLLAVLIDALLRLTSRPIDWSRLPADLDDASRRHVGRLDSALSLAARLILAAVFCGLTWIAVATARGGVTELPRWAMMSVLGALASGTLLFGVQRMRAH